MTMTRRWLVWLPVIMVASLLYWTVALGLGGMSLMAVSALSGDCGAGPLGAGPLGLSATGGDTDTAPAAAPRDGYEPILVHLEESVDPEDVDDNPGCGQSSSGGGAGGEDSTGGPRAGDQGDMRAGVVNDFGSGAAYR